MTQAFTLQRVTIQLIAAVVSALDKDIKVPGIEAASEDIAQLVDEKMIADIAPGASCWSR